MSQICSEDRHIRIAILCFQVQQLEKCKHLQLISQKHFYQQIVKVMLIIGLHLHL